MNAGTEMSTDYDADYDVNCCESYNTEFWRWWDDDPSGVAKPKYTEGLDKVVETFAAVPKEYLTFTASVDRSKIGPTDIAYKLCHAFGHKSNSRFGIVGSAAKTIIANCVNWKTVKTDGLSDLDIDGMIGRVMTAYPGPNIGVRDVDIVTSIGGKDLTEKSEEISEDAWLGGIEASHERHRSSYFGSSKIIATLLDKSVEVDIWSMEKHVFGLLMNTVLEGSSSFQRSDDPDEFDKFCLRMIANFPFNIDGYYVSFGTDQDLKSPDLRFRAGILAPAISRKHYSHDLIDGIDYTGKIPISFNLSTKDICKAWSMHEDLQGYLIGGIAKNIARAYAKIAEGTLYAPSRSLLDFYCLANGIAPTRIEESALEFCNIAGNFPDKSDKVCRETFRKRGHKITTGEMHRYFGTLIGMMQCQKIM